MNIEELCDGAYGLSSLSEKKCHYKGNIFYSVILRPCGLVRPESNLRPYSRPLPWQPGAEPPEPSVRDSSTLLNPILIVCLLFFSLLRSF